MTLIYNLGTAICHQMDDRTFHFHGNPLLVCARCTGTYTGFMFSFIYWMAVNKKLRAGTPPPYAMITAGVFIATLVIDGGTSYLHLRETNNYIRLFTGLLAGAGAAILITPCVFELIYKFSSPKLFIEKKKDFLLWIVMLIIVFFILQTGNNLLYYPLSFIISSGIIIMIFMVNSVILVLFPPWEKKQIKDWKSFFFFFIPTMIFSFLELYIAYRLHISIKEMHPL